ncbi:uncharacterized protein LOC107027679 [Solanum pennellii]|uniref:Uncharacterized protein LOC107027679 n=1 Tax=Solanum pennellii TaxID=28526 RepID=A0ABM1HE86_SOLPN|nr:uncharacterized protein LOC107027679 [Solanum pennellii]
MESTSITLKDVHSFHSFDQELFIRLVLILHHDPGVSLLAMDIWLWLRNHASCLNLIVKFLDVPIMEINLLAKEAVMCLKWVQSKVPPKSNLARGMAITAMVMDRAISFQYFYKIRFTMTSGIKNYLNDVCSIVFADILVWVLSKGYPKVPMNFPIHVPGFPHQTFGTITLILKSLDYIIPNKNEPLENIWSLKPKSQFDDRTMLLTLSRSEHMIKKEVVELFNSKYRDCVEDVHMLPPTSSKHLLYSQMVVRDVSTIDQILSTKPIAKFKINGKDVWARRLWIPIYTQKKVKK